MSEYALKIITIEEGFEPRPYLCSEGYPTVGYGQKIGKKDADISLFNFEIPEPVARLWMEDCVDALLDGMEGNDGISAALESCNEIREAVLVSMAYQMGVKGLSGFENMLRAVEFAEWDVAATEGLDSRWAAQTPERAERHMRMMETGYMKDYYK